MAHAFASHLGVTLGLSEYEGASQHSLEMQCEAARILASAIVPER
jgi:hypothetical protein